MRIKKLSITLSCFLVAFLSYGQSPKSYFEKGRLFIINSSHQDIAWMDSPDACVQFRDEHVITPALQRMSESPTFCFSVEDALSLREYLERHPEKYDEILKYTKEGRLEWGATYKQPYFSMHDGEALVRQTYFGRKWLKKVLPGCEFATAWNEDVPSMALQYPQILAKAGIPYYQFSRHQPGYYKWYSPDGSYILCWTPGQYECVGRPIRGAETEEDRTKAFAGMISEWDEYFRTRKINPGLPFIYSYDFATPLNYDNYIEDWNKKVDQDNPMQLPYIQYATNKMAMDYVIDNKKSEFDVLLGERPDVWLYIHGPAHHKAIDACRDASRILTAAEKFSTFNAVINGSFAGYPSKKFEQAWEGIVYPDHGWGGNKGEITDRVFREKYENALKLGTEILDESLNSIAENIAYDKSANYAVTVFNSLSWDRTDPVKFTINVEGRQHNHLKLVDEQGNNIPYQLTDTHEYEGNNDEVLTLVFIASDVPALGYKTYYVVEGDQDNSYSPAIYNSEYENKFYKIKFDKGGISSLYDKEIGKEYIQSEKFVGAELFTMQSVGNGAGEFTDIQQPTMEGFDKLGNYGQNWQLVESGSVYDAFQLIQPMKDVTAQIKFIVYKDIKRIDVNVDLNRFNGENWREFRLAFPINMDNSKVTYEVPMGVVEVGKDEIEGAAGFSKPEQIYSTPCKDVHPREVQDWFSVSDGSEGITISSDVAVFDYIDPTTDPVGYTILQPVLLASRKSCHGWGNYYLQPGNHSYTFSIFTHKGDWEQGYQVATQTKQPLKPIIKEPGKVMGQMPAQLGLAEVSGDGVIVSTIKKCEDDDSIIMRCYDIKGKDTEIDFKFFKPIKSAAKTNIIEEEPESLKVKSGSLCFPLGHHAIETFKIQCYD